MNVHETYLLERTAAVTAETAGQKPDPELRAALPIIVAAQCLIDAIDRAVERLAPKE